MSIWSVRKVWIVGFAAACAVIAMSMQPATAALIGVFEEPDEIGSGVGNVRGWIFTDIVDASIISPIEVFIDGVKAYEVPCCSGRKDVMETVKGAPEKTGYSGAYNWGLLEPGMHEISVVVKSTAGEMRTFTKKITTVRIGDPTFLQRLRLTEDSECTFRNNAPGTDDAGFICTNLLAEVKEGPPTLCAGGVTISWDKATQSFKITSKCEPGCEEDADCDDGLFCNGVESCDTDTGLCVAVSSCPPFLDGCVIRGGMCDEATDSCLDVPDHTACDDGVFCNGIESCDETTGSCTAISSCPPFQDGCVTRAGACDEATDSCLDVPDDSLCDDGVFCNGVESCDPVGGGCVAVSSCPPTVPTGCVTPMAICDEGTDSCLDDLDDDQCLEGEVCQPDGSCL